MFFTPAMHSYALDDPDHSVVDLELNFYEC